MLPPPPLPLSLSLLPALDMCTFDLGREEQAKMSELPKIAAYAYQEDAFERLTTVGGAPPPFWTAPPPPIPK